ncbi:MAG: hypothetical protein LBB22_06185 [Treponema sp.]|jgi:hypothetical protein|nr:hypothetical protein [Treponema sp.]
MRNNFFGLSIYVFFMVFLAAGISGCGKIAGTDSNSEETGSEQQTPDSQNGNDKQTPGTSGTGSVQTTAVVNTTWYVSSNGNDSAAGDSASNPLATVQVALNKISALYRGGKWPANENAVIIVSGKITASSRAAVSNDSMVDISGAGNYPPVILKGDPVKGGILDAASGVNGKDIRVLYIANNKVTLGDKLILMGGRRLWGGAVCIGTHGSVSEGEFIMAGGEISGSSGGSGGGVMLYKGSMSMLGGEIKNNSNDFNHNGGDGGGVYMQSATYFIMSGGKISGNGSAETAKGGGLFIDGQALALLTGGEITGNKSNTQGGGVYISPLGEFDMNGGTISGNVSGDGGGVYKSQYNGIFNQSGGIVSGNTPN